MGTDAAKIRIIIENINFFLEKASSVVVKRVFYILTLAWGFGVARFDKLGDARASTRGTSDIRGPRFHVYIPTRCGKNYITGIRMPL